MRKPLPYFPISFPLSRAAWKQLGLRDLICQIPGGEKNPRFYLARLLAERANTDPARQAAGAPWISAGRLITFGLLQDILRYLIETYCTRERPGSLENALAWTRRKRGPMVVDQTVETFVYLFSPQEVNLGLQGEQDYLSGTTFDRPNRIVCVPEAMLLSIASTNPALRPFVFLFDDGELRKRSLYVDFIAGLEDYFATQPSMRLINLNLFEALRAPQKACPDSLDGQLEYILRQWGELLPESLKRELLVARGMLREETLQRGPVGEGRAEVLSFPKPGARRFPHYPEPERFSPDVDWMSNVVMIAKSTYVWLDQLSRKYSRPIVRLDEVPDEELDLLARWGFSALWLIGLWERSSASKKIKRIMGNPEAVASAYSLYDYTIAEDLGGEAAFQNLRDRASMRGIRLASDMVPNHVGLFSRWVVEHPDWFIQTDHPPFPGYRFSGPDLSEDHRVCLQIEDGYWSHRDASVVFRRIDKATGKTVYIYHGNDGTHLPWNDTAQLNYLRADVREAAIQTILHVARKFPIIRFDAAMTLAKKHYQRLWFPFPGEGGAIPSRSEYSLTQEAFDVAIPEEFWREVVDRVAAEAPGTLLLAEAFWLMEGYFVRTLGMHRVYNSAFMNMLKMEDNANYRTTIRNVLEFSPEVLKRFVNFMNNPDEKTAVEQFGKDDKYFGTAVMMVTLPGLPMFGHGQIEGFTEKYGMEYRRAYWDEIVDEHLVRRHEAEIFPLMHQRYLFSGVDHFAFYDFRTSSGSVDENVFAYSNRCGEGRSLVLYNNAYNTTSGWVRDSVAFNAGRQEVTRLVRKTLAEALELRLDAPFYLCFRDHRTGLEYLRQNRRLAEEGLYAELRAYQYQIFLDFREIEDTDGSWGRLEDQLQGRGVADVRQAHREMTLAPLLEALGEVLRWDRIEPLVAVEADKKRTAAARKAMEKSLTRLMEAAVQMGRPQMPLMRIAKPMLEGLRRIARIQSRAAKRLKPLLVEWPFEAEMAVRPSPLEIPAKWMVLKSLKPLFAGDKMDSEDSRWMEQWLAGLMLTRSLAESGRDNQQAYLDSLMVKALLRYPDLLSLPKVSERTARMKTLFEDSDLNDLLGVNSYQGARYFNKECFDHLLDWLLGITLLEEVPSPKSMMRKSEGKADKASSAAAKMRAAAAKAGYRIDKTLQLHA